MSKAFIFDLDGVLINNEQMWETEKQKLYPSLFGPKTAGKLGSTIGLNLDAVYEKAVGYGAGTPKAEFMAAFYALAGTIYATAPITEGLDGLADVLKRHGYNIGLVSASPLAWITTVTKRLPFENDISLIISLHDRPDLAHKPEPDGYNEAMQSLESTPATTIILEDSNTGIASAKASGAFTVALKQNLVDGYVQKGADAYADTIQDVITLIENLPPVALTR